MILTCPPHPRDTDPNKRLPLDPRPVPRHTWGAPHTFFQSSVSEPAIISGCEASRLVGCPDHPSSSLVSDFRSWHLSGCNDVASHRRLRRWLLAFIYVSRNGAGPRAGGGAEAGLSQWAPPGGSLLISGRSGRGREPRPSQELLTSVGVASLNSLVKSHPRAERRWRCAPWRRGPPRGKTCSLEGRGLCRFTRSISQEFAFLTSSLVIPTIWYPGTTLWEMLLRNEAKWMFPTPQF